MGLITNWWGEGYLVGYNTLSAFVAETVFVFFVCFYFKFWFFPQNK